MVTRCLAAKYAAKHSIQPVNLQRRTGKFLKAVGWSVGLLSLGLLLGGLLAAGLDPALPLGFPLSSVQVQSLPALVVLLLGALLLG